MNGIHCRLNNWHALNRITVVSTVRRRYSRESLQLVLYFRWSPRYPSLFVHLVMTAFPGPLRRRYVVQPPPTISLGVYLFQLRDKNVFIFVKLCTYLVKKIYLLISNLWGALFNFQKTLSNRKLVHYF